MGLSSAESEGYVSTSPTPSPQPQSQTDSVEAVFGHVVPSNWSPHAPLGQCVHTS